MAFAFQLFPQFRQVLIWKLDMFTLLETWKYSPRIWPIVLVSQECIFHV